MSKIGHYIHLDYGNYLKYSLKTREEANGEIIPPNTEEVFNEQISNMRKRIKARKNRLNVNKQEIEDQLNYYYDATKMGKDEKLNNGITKEDLNKMRKSIEGFLGEKLNNVIIDENTLSSQAVKGNFKASILQAKEGYRKDLLKELSRINVNEESGINRTTVQNRINTLIEIRKRLIRHDSINSESLINTISSLVKEWGKLERELTRANTRRLQINQNDKQKKFIEDLNDLISEFLTGSSTVHGEYAEAVVVGINYLANARAQGETHNLIKGLSDVLQTNVKGQERSRKGLQALRFDSDFVDLDQVIDGTIYDSKYSATDAIGNKFSSNITQDKVDVEIDIGDLKIPASVKNINLKNKISDIHLLEGRSVLALVQDYSTFVNHYLNVMAKHSNGEPSGHGDLIDKATETMKLTILLKALEGGVFSQSTDGQIGRSQKADLFIINDNSIGRFKVYYIDDILDRIENRLNLIKTGDLDKVKRLDNDYVGSKLDGPDMGNARIRISNLLAQLHRMELNVSIDKQVFN